jgi:hypothetical protein
MKKLLSISLFSFILVAVQAQGIKSDILQSLEGNNQVKQDQQLTATLKSASRLFGDKEDLTSVIVIIPAGSVVNVLATDSIYLKVSFDENEGYIFKRDAIINTTQVVPQSTVKQENAKQNEEPVDEKRVSRFTWLENKYGTSMAARLIAGKIWKGMSAEMVKDSWGAPLKINRVIGDIVKEEWIYKNSWLFIENNTLIEWGPVNK